MWQVTYLARTRVGPRTDPYGTPNVTDHSEMLRPLVTTLCLRSLRKPCIHIKIWLLMLGNSMAFFIRSWYGTLSKAFAKSSTTMALPWSACNSTS